MTDFRIIRNIATILTGALLLSATAASAQVFSVTVNDQSANTSATETYSDFESFIDQAFSQGDFDLSDVNPTYTDNSAAEVTADFRGVPLVATYTAGAAGVVFSVPSIGFTQTFDAQGTREGNEDDLADFLEDNIDGILSQILTAAIETTPFDPLAGNPGSLQARMIANDFGMGTSLGPENGFNASGAAGDDAPNLIGVGARLGRYTADDIDTTVIELPLQYVLTLPDPRYAVIFDLPLTYVDTDGSESFASSFGVGLRVPVFDNWSLTPAVRIGGTGSVDLGSLGTLYSASLTSNAEFSLGGVDVTLGNMVSYISTTPIDTTVDDFTIEYDLQNIVSRNGLGFRGDLGNQEIFGLPATWQASVVNTQIMGDEVFIDNYTDVALSIGTEASQNGLTWDQLRLGLTYTFSNEDYEGFRVNFGYQF